jgi:hypothetical protein
VPVGGGESYSDTYWGGAWTGVKGAQSLSCLSSAGTTNPRIAIPRLLGELALLPADYETLLGRHTEVHAPLIDAFSLDLGADEADRGKPNNALVQEAFRRERQQCAGRADGRLPAALACLRGWARLLARESSGSLEWRLHSGLVQRLS